MTALQRIRQEQEALLAHPLGAIEDTGFREMHRRWLKLQRTVLAICRGERCEEGYKQIVCFEFSNDVLAI